MTDLLLSVASFGVGIVVGLTGMGGGALMTPLLVLVFGVNPLAAVSSDLLASAVTKPVGSLVHLRSGTVNLSLVKWLAVGSIPAAAGGVLLARLLGHGEQVERIIKVALGIALLMAAAGLAVRAYFRLVERARHRDGTAKALRPGPPVVVPRVLPTVIIGIVGGLLVGLTSVGAGSIIIIALMMLYPGLTASQLVGTDLAQAVPLVVAAALGHLFFGEVDLKVSLFIVLGSVPGVWVGARLSSRAPGGLVRRALAFVLLGSGLKMLGLPNFPLVAALACALVAGPLVWIALRRRYGFPAFAHSTPALIRRGAPSV